MPLTKNHWEHLVLLLYRLHTTTLCEVSHGIQSILYQYIKSTTVRLNLPAHHQEFVELAP